MMPLGFFCLGQCFDICFFALEFKHISYVNARCIGSECFYSLYTSGEKVRNRVLKLHAFHHPVRFIAMFRLSHMEMP